MDNPDKHVDEEYQPPEEVDETGGGGFRETLRGGFEKLKSLLKIAAMFFGGLLLLAVGLGLNSVSFAEIEEMRQMERTPEISPSAVVAGEVLVSGQAVEDRQTLSAPDSGEQTLYYRLEVEERDDDDGWETVRTEEDAVDFLLVEDHASVQIGATDQGIDFDAEQHHQRRDGDRRYTEHRVDPGEDLFVFGYARQVGDDYRVGFEADGQYSALISSGDESDHRHGLTITSGVMVVLGVTALLFGVFFLLRVFRVHQTALYLSVVTLVVVVSLGYQGFSMMVNELEEGREATLRTLAEGNRVITDSLEERGVDWDGDFDQLGMFDDSDYQELSSEEIERLEGVRTLMARAVERNNANLDRFPEAIVGPVMGVRPIEQMPVPDEINQQVEAVEQDHQPIRLGLPFGIGAILLGLVATLGVTRSGIGSISVKRMIEHVPTSPVAGAVYGLTELKGVAEVDDKGGPLNSPLTGSDCVFYRYKVQKKVRRKSSNGKSKTRWKTIKDVRKSTPFYCRDETGRIHVDPAGAECSAERKKYRRRGRYRYYEWTIRPGDDVYILGDATIDEDNHQQLEICNEDDDTPYLVSSLSQNELMQQKAAKGFMLLNAGIAATIMAGMGVAGTAVSFSPMLYWVMALISCGYLFFVLGFLYYNDLVFLRDRVERAWSNIDVALKKRFDLIGNLAEIVEEYYDHERGLLESVTRARTEGAERPADVGTGDEVRQQVIGRVEDHPELQSDEMVQDLMETLQEVENDIAMMRDGYNDTVERYNTRIRHIPELGVAWLCNFQDKDFLGDRRESGS